MESPRFAFTLAGSKVEHNRASSRYDDHMTMHNKIAQLTRLRAFSDTSEQLRRDILVLLLLDQSHLPTCLDLLRCTTHQISQHPTE